MINEMDNKIRGSHRVRRGFKGDAYIDEAASHQFKGNVVNENKASVG